MEASDREGKAASDHLALASLGLALSPVLGNAIAMLLDTPRRPVQAVVLGAFILLGGYGWAMHERPKFVWRRAALRQLLISIPILGVPAVVMGLLRSRTDNASGYALFALGAGILWLTLCGYALRAPREESGATRRGLKSLSIAILLIVLWWLALTAYLAGRDPNDVHMAFRGSTSVAGVVAAIAAAIALSETDGWYRIACFLPAAYLGFLSTSRIGIFLFAGLAVLAIWARWARRAVDRSTGPELAAGLLIVSACIALVAIPARSMLHYPYATSRPGESGEPVWYPDKERTEWEALVYRYSRILRIARGPRLSETLSPREIFAKELAGEADSRWLIIKVSARAILTRPWGYWPRPFSETVRVYCGRPLYCQYPHNLALEIGYYFGWLPFVAVAIGLVALSARAIASVTHAIPTVRVAALSFLGYLGLMQVSGNLADHMLALGLGLMWAFAREVNS